MGGGMNPHQSQSIHQWGTTISAKEKDKDCTHVNVMARSAFAF